MPRISEQRQQERRDAILDAAAATFVEGGFEGASTALIAQRANVSEGLIYRYFANKRALLLAVLVRFRDTIFERVELRVRNGAAFPDRFGTLIEENLRCLVEEPALSRLYLAEVRRALVEDVEQGKLLTGRARRLWRWLVAEGIASGEIPSMIDTPLTRGVIWSAIESAAALQLSGYSGESVEATASSLTALLMSGLATPAGSRDHS